MTFSAILHDGTLFRYFLETLRLTVWLVILAAVFLPLEWLLELRPQKRFSRSLLSDLGFYFIIGLVPNLLLALPLAVVAYASYRFVPWRIHAAVEAWPIWVRGLAAFVVGDFGFYWGHRWAHEWRAMWRFHAIHHHPKHVYFLVSARAHPVDFVFIRLWGLIPIYVIGLGAPQSVQGTIIASILMLWVTVWGFFIHSNVRLRLGPLEWLISTPAFHHWHHTLEEPRNRNYASMLPVMDWMFGTLHLPRGEWPASYGIDDPLPRSVLGQLVHPFLLPGPRPSTPSPAQDAAAGQLAGMQQRVEAEAP